MIQTKAHMFDSLVGGVLGNSLRVWDSVRAVVEDGYDGLIGLRCVGFPGSPAHMNLTLEQASEKARLLVLLGYTVVFCESAGCSGVVLQGEFGNDCGGIPALSYSTGDFFMREAMERARYVVGPTARLILKRYLDASSYEDILTLSDLHPGCIIEFTAFDRCVGPLRGRNTLIWEVRNY